MPTSAAQEYTIQNVWQSGGDGVPETLDANHETTITLAPFEVLTLQLTPVVPAR